MRTPDGYMTVYEVARRLEMTVATVYRWLDSGVVEGTHVGSSRFVQLASLRKHVGPSAVKWLDGDGA